MTKKYGVIKISKRNDMTGYTDVSFFTGIGADASGHIEVRTTDDPCKAILLSPLPFDTIGGSEIKNLVEFINKVSFKDVNAEFVTFQIEL